jgi:hypothetical protein
MVASADGVGAMKRSTPTWLPAGPTAIVTVPDGDPAGVAIPDGLESGGVPGGTDQGVGTGDASAAVASDPADTSAAAPSLPAPEDCRGTVADAEGPSGASNTAESAATASDASRKRAEGSRATHRENHPSKAGGRRSPTPCSTARAEAGSSGAVIISMSHAVTLTASSGTFPSRQ